ncbi:MAG: 4-(cytidine 5'-diphospho)-2-C-methyl-D-erythritol kinase [Sphingobacteriales bacterium]|nr:4-(cytidine 5'-diphospho)-2-C-methyl-D-erythritol kinase [Sphingobacteriales bacterium]
MIVYPNCKINLGLHILRKRADGYHDLETVFYPTRLNDILEIIPGHPGGQTDTIAFTQSGIEIAGPPADNLCVKAYRLLKNDFPDLPPVQLHLHKIIPSGAGLGGGSADAAFTLKLLNDSFNLGITAGKLIEYALQLGSDCPFFILNQPCLAGGRGEKLEKLELSLQGYQLLLVNPGIHIHTGKAFAALHPALPSKPLKEIILQPVHTWKEELVNDFEKAIFAAYPAIAAIKDQLYQAGCHYASMSGSGSTVYGLYPAGQKIRFDFPPHYFIKSIPA